MKLKEHLKIAHLVKMLESDFEDLVYTQEWQKMKCMLDTDYHSEITDKEWDKYQHIYYGVE